MVETATQENGSLRKKFCHFIEHQPQFALRKSDHTGFICMDAMEKKQKNWKIILLPWKM